MTLLDNGKLLQKGFGDLGGCFGAEAVSPNPHRACLVSLKSSPPLLFEDRVEELFDVE